MTLTVWNPSDFFAAVDDTRLRRCKMLPEEYGVAFMSPEEARATAESHTRISNDCSADVKRQRATDARHARSLAKGNVCKACGARILAEATWCASCASKTPRKRYAPHNNRVSREKVA